MENAKISVGKLSICCDHLMDETVVLSWEGEYSCPDLVCRGSEVVTIKTLFEMVFFRPKFYSEDALEKLKENHKYYNKKCAEVEELKKQIDILKSEKHNLLQAIKIVRGERGSTEVITSMTNLVVNDATKEIL